MTTGRRRLAALIAVLVPGLLSVVVLSTGYDGGSYLRADCAYYMATTQSLLQDRDLDLANQLWQPWRDHTGDISIDQAGRLVPKHPLWMPIAALPLIALLGEPGALVFNILQVLGLCALMYLLARRVAGPWTSSLAVCLTATLSFLPHYVWNFSPDVFTAVLFLGALALLPEDRSAHFGRHLGAGLLLALAATAKPVFALPACLVPLLAGQPLRRSLAVLALGVALPSTLWLSLNSRLFGHPLVTSYDRIVHFSPGGIEVHSQREDFDLPLRRGAWGQLTDPKRGLLRTSPITILGLLLLPCLLRRDRAWGLFVGFGCAAVYLFYSTYALWPASHWGNRFLMPVVALGVVPLAAGMAALSDLSRRSPSRCRPGPDPQPPSAGR